MYLMTPRRVRRTKTFYYIGMSERAKSCYLRSNSDSLSTVYLPDSTPIFIGRSQETNITDTKCSRQQVRLCADYLQHTVSVQQIGTRACGINGFKTQKDVRSIINHNDYLEILYGKHTYQIEFNPPPKEKQNQKFLRKRSYDSEDESLSMNTTNSYKIRKVENECNATIQETINKNDYSRNEEDNEELNSIASTSKGNDTDNNKTKGTELWENNKELLIYTSSNIQNRTKIAAYDMDGTLIKTKSGLIFPKDCNDWQLLFPEVPKKLKQLYEDGYKIVIFTNQRALGTGKVTIEDFKIKIERVVQKLGVPIQVFVSIGKDICRKPAPGMWNKLINYKNGGFNIDKSNSFYVGDAAGRQKNWAPGKKKDHSKVDRLMAMNIGLQFQTPEEHFLGHKAVSYVLPTFDPKALLKDGDICHPADAKITSKQQEIILMVGSPGSGKSHFTKLYLSEYDYINRDTLGSWQKCISAMEQSLIQGKRVVIDNTNPDPASRERYIVVAKKYSIPVRCFLMTTSTEHAKHNNRFRELTDSNHVKISDIIINSYMKNYVPPTLEEGFTELVKINFIPRFFSERDKELYEMYLLEN
ncbi:uncharacterized protein F21D5.5 isoform X2 [Vespa crabro]|uniref:uncharacterized protein F21D5.5 isoform X2 n=1 Tax=Vespa crabro TaxID=7445 RepID=UPI001F00C623|nr:uncharacterized protein F21D5.5 isoform X2 [Vespa crabro]